MVEEKTSVSRKWERRLGRRAAKNERNAEQRCRRRLRKAVVRSGGGKEESAGQSRRRGVGATLVAVRALTSFSINSLVSSSTTSIQKLWAKTSFSVRHLCNKLTAASAAMLLELNNGVQRQTATGWVRAALPLSARSTRCHCVRRHGWSHL